MIEMLGVLAIVGVLSVGGIAGYSKAMTKFKTNQIADQVATIVTNIKTLYAQQKDYSGLNNASAVAMGIIPEELGTDYRNLTNPFGGSFNINYNNRKTDSFEIFLCGLPREACLSLASNDWGSSSELIAILAMNNCDPDFGTVPEVCDGFLAPNAALACPGGSNVSVPIPPQIAARACNCEGNTCAVGWKYY